MKYLGKFPILPERGYFRKGDTGREVKRLQKLLNFLLHGSKDKKLVLDGEFGPKTRRAVRVFQITHGLKATGHFGNASLKHAKKYKMTLPMMAVNWAVSVALDNSFTYGEGERAHRCGCYFCGTNTGPRKKKKEKQGEPHKVEGKDGKTHTYEKTYCCNTFTTAAYAHGAGVDAVLKVCRAGGCLGMTPGEYTRRGFTKVGKCKNVKTLKPGDIIISNSQKGGKYHHVWMYIGHDRYVHASGESWSAGSISIHARAGKTYRQNYAKYDGTYVIRYEL